MKRIERRLFLLATAAGLAHCVSGCGGGGSQGGNAGAPATPTAPLYPAGSLQSFAAASRSLQRTMSVSVYLPPGYAAGTRYPVLYLFYGYGGHDGVYFDGGLAINRTADRLIASGAIGPLVMVVPGYDNSFGVNTTPAQAPDSAGGSIGPYEDYLIGEMMPFVEGRLGMAPAPADRRVGGVSMGGFAALHLALRHPGLFGRVGAHSAALWDYSEADQFRGQRDWLYPTPALRAERDPLLLAERVDMKGMRFYIDVGNRDGLRRQDEAMHAALTRHGGASELHVGDGGHDAAYWGSQLQNWLALYGAP